MRLHVNRSVLLFIVLTLSGCTVLDFLKPDPSAAVMNEALIRSEYVGSTFETEHGETVRFKEDFSFTTGDGRTGTYEIGPENQIRFFADKNSYLLAPDGSRINRPDLGLTVRVSRPRGRLLHTAVPGGQAGSLEKVDQ